MNRRNLAEVQRLADQVASLAGKAKALVERDMQKMMAEDDWADNHDPDEVPGWLRLNDPKLGGELRRRSMDLTRALAELRKS